MLQHKGYPVGDRTAKRLRCAIPGVATEHFHYGEDWFQFGMARDSAERLDHDYLLFFISWSRVLGDNWLKTYLDAFAADPTRGLVGATGSFEGIPEAPFPNPNIRTNAFMIRRDLFLSLDLGNVASHRSGYAFEAGPNSLTRQIVTRGHVPYVVGRDGRRFAPDNWRGSRTFRSGQQENLLVADNRTHDFATARPSRRRRLAQLAWGDIADLEPNDLLGRWRADLAWRAPVIASSMLWR